MDFKYKDKNGNLQQLGFKPTPDQLLALNSGIDSTKVAQISQNASDILSKQDTLVSGSNIKTINNESLLGNGNIDLGGGGADFTLIKDRTQIPLSMTTGTELNLSSLLADIQSQLNDYNEINIQLIDAYNMLSFNCLCPNPKNHTTGTLYQQNTIITSIPFITMDNYVQTTVYVLFLGKANLMFRYVNNQYELVFYYDGFILKSDGTVTYHNIQYFIPMVVAEGEMFLTIYGR